MEKNQVTEFYKQICLFNKWQNEMRFYTEDWILSSKLVQEKYAFGVEYDKM